MKKILTLVAALCCAVAAMATDYDGLLTVVVNNDTTQQEAKISLTQSANGYKLSLVRMPQIQLSLMQHRALLLQSRNHQKTKKRKIKTWRGLGTN